MTFSWGLTALFAYLIFRTDLPTALIIGAYLSSTYTVLAASVLSKSRFSKRVPRRLKHLLSAESACNDGVSFPFLYIGILALSLSSSGEAQKEWFLITVLWQFVMGLAIGLGIRWCANRALRFFDLREYISQPSFVVFCLLLLAILRIGVGSILGSDDFLIAFGAGVGFAQDGWFSKKTRSLPFPTIIDLMLNSSMFFFFGAIIPWHTFVPGPVTPNCGIWQLHLFLALVTLFRRMRVVLALKRFIPDIRTYRETIFCGHFGPMGVEAFFLAMEARTELDTQGSSVPSRTPCLPVRSHSDKAKAIHLIWPVFCFTVLGSILVHRLSTLVISVGRHYIRKVGERAPLFGQETEGFDSVVHEGGGGESEPEVSGSD